MENKKRITDAKDAQKVREILAMCCNQVTAPECAKCVYHEYEGGFCIERLMKDALDVINQIDVVRCKDCKHWGVQENCDPSLKYYCNADALYAWGRPVRNADDFCSYGERKDNG